MMFNGCGGIINGTFIMCGEGGNYCSDSCYRNALATQKEGAGMIKVGDIITGCSKKIVLITEWLEYNGIKDYYPSKKMDISYPAIIIDQLSTSPDSFWKVLDADGVTGYIPKKVVYVVNK